MMAAIDVRVTFGWRAFFQKVARRWRDRPTHTNAAMAPRRATAAAVEVAAGERRKREGERERERGAAEHPWRKTMLSVRHPLPRALERRLKTTRTSDAGGREKGP